jgi:uncharacterized YigZ family protein
LVPQVSGRDYCTVRKPARAEITEKKSRFIASVARTGSVLEAQEFIDRVSGEFRDASHNTYAYIVNEGGMLHQKHSDAGEPQGTAGLPIMEVLKNSGLVNSAAVVTRYFGGTLLGAGGLARAYGKSALAGVEKAGIIRMVYSAVAEITSDYHLSQKVLGHIASLGYIIVDTAYTHNVIIRTAVPLTEKEKFYSDIINITNARAVIEYISEKYVEMEV